MKDQDKLFEEFKDFEIKKQEGKVKLGGVAQTCYTHCTQMEHGSDDFTACQEDSPNTII